MVVVLPEPHGPARATAGEDSRGFTRIGGGNAREERDEGGRAQIGRAAAKKIDGAEAGQFLENNPEIGLRIDLEIHLRRCGAAGVDGGMRDGACGRLRRELGLRGMAGKRWLQLAGEHDFVLAQMREFRGRAGRLNE